MITIHTLANCDTCRKATKWLRARQLEFTEKPIRETPPSLAELRAMLAHQNGELSRLFNTAGQDYRAAGLKEKLPQLSTADALALLAANGNLVKRPFLLYSRGGLVGFDEAVWAQALEKPPATQPRPPAGLRTIKAARRPQ